MPTTALPSGTDVQTTTGAVTEDPTATVEYDEVGTTIESDGAADIEDTDTMTESTSTTPEYVSTTVVPETATNNEASSSDTTKATDDNNGDTTGYLVFITSPPCDPSACAPLLTSRHAPPRPLLMGSAVPRNMNVSSRSHH